MIRVESKFEYVLCATVALFVLVFGVVIAYLLISHGSSAAFEFGVAIFILAFWATNRLWPEMNKEVEHEKPSR